MLASKFENSLPFGLTSIINEKAQFKVAFRRYCSTHSCHPIELFYV